MKNIFTLIALLFVGVAFAQPDEDPREERKEKIKAHKIAFISTELDLSPEEAEKFWPIYNELEDKMEEIHTQRRAYMKKLKNFDELSDNEAYEITEKLFELEAEEHALRKEYLGKFATAVGKKKAAKVFMAEEKFKRELLRKLKHQQEQRRNGGPGHGGPPR
ncbi:MAG: hypothetical protein HUJ25_15585 [Crocinitomicaceae bacterium]|nr:hypothetical protein [Crocinitomicaceae bacterium]